MATIYLTLSEKSDTLNLKEIRVRFKHGKKWTYKKATKNTNEELEICWSYNTSWFNNSEDCYLHLHVYDGKILGVELETFNNINQNSIASAGFKLTNSEIEDNMLWAYYESTNFTLIIITKNKEYSAPYTYILQIRV